MLRFLILFVLHFLTSTHLFSQLQNNYKKNITPEYDELIQFYQKLDQQHQEAKLIEMGKTDIGLPLYVFLMNKEGQFDSESYSNKTVLLINNGIHPGEPCGVDASLNIAYNWLSGKKLPKNVVIAIIPLYNVGGALNRSCCSRANQNGPKEYGFRGNAQNLDLNRDFIKTDSRNARSFTEVFHWLKPDVFLDAHSTNGADYQYPMTLITTQPDKLGDPLGSYVKNNMQPFLYQEMKKKGVPMSPYVNVFGRTPKNGGIHGFLETPRYSTGYTALFNTIGFTSEAHMWKPYPQRVEATMHLIEAIVQFMNENSSSIKKVRKEAFQKQKERLKIEINWTLDTNSIDTLSFLGYKDAHINSKLTGHKRLKYYQDQPETQNIPYLNHFKASKKVLKPKYYIIPQAWPKVIERLKSNQIELDSLKNDTTIDVNAYYIQSYQTRKSPYEGHYLHYDIKTTSVSTPVTFRKGDYIVHTDQKNVRYLVETLEPEAPDGFFAWNFFDAILQQKEWFSDYVFEEKAIKILKEDQELKKEFELAKKDNPELKKSHWQQLYWIYKHSEYYEKTHNRYPVFRYFE